MRITKRPRLLAGGKNNDANAVTTDDDVTTADKLSVDVVAIIFSFLRPEDIMRLRRVCSKWKEAAKKALVPLTGFEVDSVRSYNALRVMSTALPNLQQLSLNNLGPGHKYSDGEVDHYPDEYAETANWTVYDIDIMSNFRELRSLDIREAPLNGIYPALFNFPLLQKLTIWHPGYLEWDLHMLSGLPLLKELDFISSNNLDGNLFDLRVLKDTLEKVEIYDCRYVEGNFMDLADFPHLKELDLRWTNVTGDIRDIRENDFPVMEYLSLPKGVHGGEYYGFQNVTDVPEFMHTIHILLQRTPTLFDRENALSKAFHWNLSRESPDWYASELQLRNQPLPYYLQIVQDEFESPPPPFHVKFIQAGSRRGWSWCTEGDDHSCEIHWLDPEPDRESGDYEAYIEELHRIERRIGFYRGHHQPPTEEEHRRLCEGLT